MRKFIAYYRVSTKQQGNSGLGLAAQKTLVENYLKVNNGEEIIPPFKEVESGKNNERPELQKAIKKCKQTGATLLIAKLDRLSRNVAFIFNLRDELQKAGVGFIACDIPEANTLNLGIMAAFAQHERERISERTKEGLAEAKRKGKILGKPENLTKEAREKALVSISRNAMENKYNKYAYLFIKPLREKGVSFTKIAKMLNKEGYLTRRGNQFHAQSVINLTKLFANK